MANIAALATMKGGSGKSTIAVCLAAHWKLQGHDVAIIDADPQRSVARWLGDSTCLDELILATANDDDIREIVSNLLARNVDLIIIDTPGFRATVTEVAVTMADLCIIPVRPSPVDFEVAADEVEIIAGLRQSGAKGPKAYRFLVSQFIQGSVISRHMRLEMQNAGYELFNSEIGHRVAYAETALLGSTPSIEYPGSAAAKEITRLALEVEDILFS